MNNNIKLLEVKIASLNKTRDKITHEIIYLNSRLESLFIKDINDKLLSLSDTKYIINIEKHFLHGKIINYYYSTHFPKYLLNLKSNFKLDISVNQIKRTVFIDDKKFDHGYFPLIKVIKNIETNGEKIGYNKECLVKIIFVVCDFDEN